jgi:prepilin-type processing-associated H-X9-DG protein
MASTRADVFRTYGRPIGERVVRDLKKQFDNQVLYTRKGLLSRQENSKIFYRQHGLLFWFEGEKILQIVIHPKDPEANERPRASTLDLEARVESATRMEDLAKALLIFANDHDDRFPEELSDLREEVRVGMSWLLENVTYVGRNVSPRRDLPSRVLAYDKTLLEKGAGTNVLYLDSHVAFEEPEVLEKLGIKPGPPATGSRPKEAAKQARVAALRNLKHLALAALMYANEHDDKLPADLEALSPYLARDRVLESWVRENAVYLGEGLTTSGTADAGKTPIAYYRLPSDQFAVVFLDGHAAVMKGGSFTELGIGVPPSPRR